jgi:hypothetical protein
MNVPYQKTMTLERINAEEFLTNYGLTSNEGLPVGFTTILFHKISGIASARVRSMP